MNNFRELKVWQRSKDLTLTIYKLTRNFPDEGKFGLTSQIRRCAVSVPSNIAEGCGRNSEKQLLHFLNVSMGSLSELETQLIISSELSYLATNDSEILLKEVNEIQKMLSGLMKSKKV